jgi:hypothetical protein
MSVYATGPTGLNRRPYRATCTATLSTILSPSGRDGAYYLAVYTSLTPLIYVGMAAAHCGRGATQLKFVYFINGASSIFVTAVVYNRLRVCIGHATEKCLS